MYSLETHLERLCSAEIDSSLELFLSEWLKRMHGEYGIPKRPGIENFVFDYEETLDGIIKQFLAAEYGRLGPERLQMVADRLGTSPEIQEINISSIHGLSGPPKRQQMFHEMWSKDIGNPDPSAKCPQGILLKNRNGYTLVDGNHRYLRLLEQKTKKACYVVYTNTDS